MGQFTIMLNVQTKEPVTVKMASVYASQDMKGKDVVAKLVRNSVQDMELVNI
jgi:hypothetical protein